MPSLQFTIGASSSLLLLALILLPIHNYLHKHALAPYPIGYMDEIFHIPQAQSYCRGNWSHWDGKITTPPGLYLVSVSISKLASVLEEQCEKPYFLRFTNVLFTLANFNVVFSILLKLQNNPSNAGNLKNLLHTLTTSLTLTLFPLTFFYGFLYYTDIGSLFFILLAYRLSLSRYFWTSSMFCVASLFFRQTNIIWVVFIAGVSVLDELRRIYHINRYVSLVDISLPIEEIHGIFDLIRLIVKFLINCLFHAVKLMQILIRYSGVVIGFLAFVLVNGSIVMGDKENHTSSLHIPQIFYFFTFSCLFLWPHLVLDRNGLLIRQSLSAFSKHPIWSIVAAGVVYKCIKDFTIVHPFLLADNRHYTFYIWSRILRDRRYLFIPVYLLSGHLLLSILSRGKRPLLWIIIYFVCTAATLVPSPLLEFRYFIVPYFMLRLHVNNNSGAAGREPAALTALVLELTTYLIINAFTGYMFVFKPFYQPDRWGEELQRFMW